MVNKNRVKPYTETHQQGTITIEKALPMGVTVGDFGIQIASDGRVWICVDGEAIIRFKSGSSWGNRTVPSETVEESVENWYLNTISQKSDKTKADMELLWPYTKWTVKDKSGS